MWLYVKRGKKVTATFSSPQVSSTEMKRRRFLQSTALAASAACLGVRPAGLPADSKSVAAQRSSAISATTGAGKQSGPTWQRIGPDFEPTKGVCYCVLPHAQRPGELLVGARPQGLLLSMDYGKTWRRLTQGLPTGKTIGSADVSQTVTKVFINAEKPGRVWLGMYASGFHEPAGVWRSEDGGETWLPSSGGIDHGDQVVGSITCRRDWVMGFAPACRTRRYSSRPRCWPSIAAPTATRRGRNSLIPPEGTR